MKFLLTLLLYFFSLSALAKQPVLVAVVDMGIDYYSLSDLKPYMFENSKWHKGWDFGENEPSNGIDYNYKHEGQHHGTFIAFLIARPQYKNSKRIQLLDVVYSDYFGNLFKLNQYMFPENNLQVYRRKKAYEQFSQHLAKTFAYAEQMGAKVINFSSSDRGFKSEALELYLKKAQENKTFIVVSAGNDGYNIDEYPQYPCNYKLINVICVGAVDKKSKKTNYSNYGKDIDLYAQGNFGSFEGTSFSAPIISRALALIIYNNPNWSQKQVRGELFKYVETKNSLPVFNIQKFHKKYL